MKEEYAKFNPELQPKTHNLVVSYWLPKGEKIDHEFDKVIEGFFWNEGFEFSGKGFDFAERRRDVEFKKDTKNRANHKEVK